MKILSGAFLVAMVLYGVVGCEKEISNSQVPPDRLSVDIAATDAMIHVRVTDYASRAAYLQLTRNGEPLAAMRAPIDTVIVDDSLVPSTTYLYKLRLVLENAFNSVLEQSLVKTLDTTSHAFNWQLDTLSNAHVASSYINDVAIISPTNIWAVGEIYISDSAGILIQPPFNVARWDGVQWRLLRPSAPGYGYGTLYSIFAFDSNDVWLGGSIPIHWNGVGWTFYGGVAYPPGGFRILRVWGNSTNDIYSVGEYGSIRHFDGSQWQAVTSGTTEGLHDLYGARDQQTGKETIYCVAGERYGPTEGAVLSIEGLSVSHLPTAGLPQSLRGIWFASEYRNYVVGDGIFFKADLNDVGTWRRVGGPAVTSYVDALRGTAANDIFAVGDFGEVLHYNGRTWKNYQNEVRFGGIFWRVEMKNDFVVAVGEDGLNAVVLRGYR